MRDRHHEPADGSALSARETQGGVLSAAHARARPAPAGSVVYLSANCRPEPCDARATATGSGRWTPR